MSTETIHQATQSKNASLAWHPAWTLLITLLLLGALLILVMIATLLIMPLLTSASCQVMTGQPMTFEVETAIQACWLVR